MQCVAALCIHMLHCISIRDDDGSMDQAEDLVLDQRLVQW